VTRTYYEYTPGQEDEHRVNASVKRGDSSLTLVCCVTELPVLSGSAVAAALLLYMPLRYDASASKLLKQLWRLASR
jgi:hypothetical protein